MNILLLTLLACGDKDEDTGIEIDVDDTGVEDTDTEDTNETDTEETDTEESDPLEIIGSYSDNWGGAHTINEATWSDGYGGIYHISQFDNDVDWLVAQNDVGNAYNPELWSKFEWTTDNDGGLFYCQSAYDAASEEDAMAATADANDLAAGCGGFGWSELRVELDLTGNFTDNWGGSHTINSFSWNNGGSVFHIQSFDNDANWAVALNDSANSWNPDLFSKFEWTTDSNGGWFYCQSAYDAATIEDAMAAAADANDLAAGCGGFGWSEVRVEFDLTGNFTDNWGGSHSINSFSWNNGDSVFHIQDFDNGSNWAVALNDSANSWNPDLFSKFEWTTDSNGGWFYCQSAYDAATAEDAMAATADANDLAAGCGGFGWSEVRVELDLTGNFTDNWGYSHSINSFSWTNGSSVFHIQEFDNEANWAIALNDSANSWNPDLFSKFEWTSDSSGAWFYCQSAYDAATAEDAKVVNADANDLDAGCGGFGWSELTSEVAE